MHKRIKITAIIACMLAAIFALSGCVSMLTSVDIHADGSADISIKSTVSAEVYKMFSTQDNTNLIDDTKAEASAAGYAVEEYNENGYVGVIMTKHIDSTDAIGDKDKYVEGLAFERTSEPFKKTISVSGTLASIQSLKQNLTASSIDTSSFDLKLIVNAPYPITETNATEVSADRKQATFDLVQLDTIELKSEHSAVLFGIIPMTGASIVVVILAAAALALIIIGAIKKRIRTKANETQK